MLDYTCFIGDNFSPNIPSQVTSHKSHPRAVIFLVGSDAGGQGDGGGGDTRGVRPHTSLQPTQI